MSNYGPPGGGYPGQPQDPWQGGNPYGGQPQDPYGGQPGGDPYGGQPPYGQQPPDPYGQPQDPDGQQRPPGRRPVGRAPARSDARRPTDVGPADVRRSVGPAGPAAEELQHRPDRRPGGGRRTDPALRRRDPGVRDEQRRDAVG